MGFQLYRGSRQSISPTVSITKQGVLRINKAGCDAWGIGEPNKFYQIYVDNDTKRIAISLSREKAQASKKATVCRYGLTIRVRSIIDQWKLKISNSVSYPILRVDGYIDIFDQKVLRI